ncbi:peptidyl-prolyl cis-trans isomerase [Xylophilus rhododendri]|uniref:Peptidyl-prolyl cis-trans isomerase n=1 Tax=Xylophilus rhododendri TaxID=2697032 RepID=A0A857JAF5_9BURK|nr:peptidylprolyl isomerase [Xylophilus rhododendri]QHI99725.1 peptidyl-prolyl cis-trans isomerase [Xylophilus rhododendri]
MNAPAFFQRAAKEPLLHFLLLGALIFAADHFIDSGREKPQTITVGADVQKEAHDIFLNGMGREPSADDMKKLTDRWTDNEILYREGLALGLDRGDTTIRERVIFKSLSVMQSGITLPKIDEPGLQKWFEARRARYDAPARYDFLEAVIVGDSTPESTKAFVDALAKRAESDTQSDLRSFKNRPRTNLVASYGEDFTKAMDQATPQQWIAVPSSAGLRVVMLEAAHPPVPAVFEDIKPAVYQDWRDDTMAEMSSAAVREMGKKYTVRIAPAAEGGKP